MITLEQLLALRDCAKASANTDAACRSGQDCRVPAEYDLVWVE